jgi:hypothetical protein
MSQKSNKRIRKVVGNGRSSTKGIRLGWCVHKTKPTKRVLTIEGDYATVSRAGHLHVFRGYELIRSFQPGHWEAAYPEVAVNNRGRVNTKEVVSGEMEEA